MAGPIQKIQSSVIQMTGGQGEDRGVFQILVSQGLLDEIPAEGDLPLPDFTPLSAKGKPTSEIIIEDRGEQ